MHQRRLPAVAALLTAATLTLTACGGGDTSSDEIPGADQASKSTSPRPSASATPDDGIDRPDIETPGFNTTFEDWKSSDPKKQAVLTGGKERMRSLLSAVIKNDKKPDYVTFYSTRAALQSGLKWVHGFQDKNLTLTGKTRYFNPIVEFGKDSATLNFCNDQNGGHTKHRDTGKVDNEGTADKGLLYKTKLVKNKKGIWQTTFTLTVDGGCDL